MSSQVQTTTTAVPALRRADPNAINLADYKGDIRVCPFCKPLDRLGGRACPWCMSRGYVAACTNCDSTGLSTSKSVWDGKSDHSSTCNFCGGKGMYPASEKEFVKAGGKTQAMLDAEVEDSVAATGLPETVPVSTAPVKVVTEMKNLQMTRGKSNNSK